VRNQEPPGGWDRPIPGATPESRSRRGLWWAAGAVAGVFLLALWLVLIAAAMLVVVLVSKAL
jgi:hypothetical protein